MKLYLMRHCATDDGKQMVQSRPLNDTGEMQAHAIRKFLKMLDVSPDVIISSDFARAHHTAMLVARGQTPIKTTPFLRPDITWSDKGVTSALKSILKLAGDAKTVLVVTHGPLIQRLLAAVAFNFVDEEWGWEHGAIAYVNTGDSEGVSRFRWFVTPKLAAHLTGAEDPKDVENEPPVPITAAEREAFARQMLAMAESLKRAHKAAALAPLIAEVKSATERRFRKQRARVLHAVRKFAPAWKDINYVPIHMAMQGALGFNDSNFAKSYTAATTAARASGAAHVTAQLGLKEAARKVPVSTPKKKRTAQDLEDELDQTTENQLGNKLKDVFSPTNPLSLAGTLAMIKQTFDQYISGTDGQKSRSSTVAQNEISGAYHDGGATVAANAGGNVEKMWDIGADGCPICTANADQGWIPDDDVYESGDSDPPAHPNCDCSQSYRIAED